MNRPGDRRRRLFTGQATVLGVFCGMLVVPASSVFLGEYGAENLPWTYIVVAVGAMVGTPALGRAVQRWTLPQIGAPLWCTLGGFALSAWVGLEFADARWVSAPLLVLFPLGILIGFFFIGGQAGRVFDVREMKEQFPRVVVGFPFGFLLASLSGDVLIGVFGGVERLLPIAAASAVGLAWLIRLAGRRFPEQLGRSPRASAADSGGTGAHRRVPVRALITNRYVAVLLGYQMLSQLGTQLVDFLVFERSAARYEGDAELGRFIARITTVLNVVDLLFVLVLAGLLLRRFGMRVGLSLNPFVVTALMVGAAIAAMTSGIDSTAVFVLIITARVLDIAFTDGATRTALNTAFQAVPPSERLAVQATIEGLGVPVALGITGVILLVLQQGLGVGAWGITVLAVGVGVVWTVAGIVVFRSYRTNLRDGLERRVLTPAALDLDDPVTVREVDRMLASDDQREVWTALTAIGEHPRRVERLEALAGSADERIASTAFRQLSALDHGRAVAAAMGLTRASSPSVRFDAIGLLARHGPPSPHLATIEAAFDDVDPAARAAARRAAVASGDPALLARVVHDSRGSPHIRVAVDALSAAGDGLLPFVVAALEDDEPRHTIRLLRCLRPSPAVVTVLAAHIRHADHDVAVVVRETLGRAGDSGDAAGHVEDLLGSEARRASRVLAATVALPPDGRLDLVRRCLDDELDAVTRSVLATLMLAGDHRLIADAARGLRRADGTMVAHAVETLELYLPARWARLVVPIIDRRLDAPARLDLLRAVVDVPTFDLDTALADLVETSSGSRGRRFTAECAAHARSALTAER